MVAIAEHSPGAAIMSTSSSTARTASEAADAINDLLHFSDKDQELLLHVIEDNFDPRRADISDEDGIGT